MFVKLEEIFSNAQEYQSGQKERLETTLAQLTNREVNKNTNLEENIKNNTALNKNLGVQISPKVSSSHKNDIEKINKLLESLVPGEDLEARCHECMHYLKIYLDSDEGKKKIRSIELKVNMNKLENSLKILQNIISENYNIEDFLIDIVEFNRAYPADTFGVKFLEFGKKVSKKIEIIHIINGDDIQESISFEEIWIKKYNRPAISMDIVQ